MKRAEGVKSFFKKCFNVVKPITILLFQFFLLGTICFRVIPIPLTPLMVLRPTSIQKDWVAYENISPNMPIAAMTTEDPNFPTHWGFEFKAMKEALEDNIEGKKKLKRGGSTISQQTAKNVLLFPGSGLTRYARKVFEFPLTAWIELMWNKRRIMEVYLNIIEMGDGIYGVEAAAQHYFNKPAAKLTSQQAAAIAVCLPNPLKINPTKLSPRLTRKRDRTVRWMRGYKLPDVLQP